MVSGGKEAQVKYMRKWRKAHPNYGRDWTRRKRGFYGLKGWKNILGIRVDIRRLRYVQSSVSAN